MPTRDSPISPMAENGRHTHTTGKPLMDHRDHVNLIRAAIPTVEGATAPVWADLGSGTGAFTLALADLLGPHARIISVDADRRALDEQARAMRRQFPQSSVEYRAGDFTAALDLPLLDGIVMANSLHYVSDRDKPALLRRLKAHLRPGGRFVVVEYNTDHGNTWVPHPFSYGTWERMAAAAGFSHTELTATVPSRFLREIYAAASW